MGDRFQSNLHRLRFFATPPHPCSYLPEHLAVTAFVEPQLTPSHDLYSELSRHGFRRSGQHIYRPHCPSCQACVPVRIKADLFKPNRQQRRTLKRNRDLRVVIQEAAFDEESYGLYEHYIAARHSDGDMFPASRSQFRDFLLCDWSDTYFLKFYSDKELLAVCVADKLADGFSAVYTFFCPQQEKRSLGRFAILQLIQLCQRLQLEYVYLGYFIDGCQKMSYKNEYRPQQQLMDNQWRITLD